MAIVILFAIDHEQRNGLDHGVQTDRTTVQDRTGSLARISALSLSKIHMRQAQLLARLETLPVRLGLELLDMRDTRLKYLHVLPM